MGKDLLHRLRSLFMRRTVERELDDELRFHIVKQAEKYERQGLSSGDALRKARLDFGGIDKAVEECREARGFRVAEDLWSDVRHGLRALRKAPVFAVAVCLILGVGIGVNMTLFQFLNAVTLRPLAVKDPDTLVRFWRKSPDRTESGVPYPAAQFLRDHNDVLSAVLLRVSAEVAWGDEGADMLMAMFVSSNWFEELGYGAAVGRLFSEDVDQQANDVPAIVLSHRFWVRHFQRATDVIGRTVRINGRSAKVIGIVPAGFPADEFRNPEVWAPIERMDYFNPGIVFEDAWSRNDTAMYGRIRDGLSVTAARDGMRAAVQELARQRPDAFHDDEWLEPLSGAGRFLPPEERRQIWQQTLLMGGLTFLIFCVSCANVCSLVVSRAIARSREFGMRAALGANRWRLIRCLIGETALLAGLGATTGVLLGYGAAELLATLPGVPPLNLTPDWRTLLAGGGFAFLAVFASGVVPGWIVSRQARLGLVIKDGGPQTSSGPQRGRFNQALVAVQVAGSCVLLVLAGLFVSNLARLLQAGPGFEVDRVAVLQASPTQYGIRGMAVRAYWDEIKRSVGSHPEVAAVTLASHLPLSGTSPNSEYPDARGLVISVLRVEPEFFPLMGIRIIAGRSFDSSDVPQEAVVISRSLAVRMYGSVDVIGERFPKTGRSRTIVGVAEDAPVIRYPATDGAEQYVPLTSGYFEGQPGNPVLLARAKNDPLLLLTPIRQAARQAAPKVLPRLSLMRSALQNTVAPYRAAAFLLSLTSFMALLLACLGVFGLVSYGMTLRTKELGIRMALGADRQSLVSGLLGRLARPAFWGAVAGVVVALALAKALEGEPLYLIPADLRAYAAALLILFAAAGTAASIPVIRALRSDPLKSLKHD